MRKIGLLLLVFNVSICTWSQITYPKASPFSKLEQEIGLSKITLEYSRPAVRGRELFGEQADGQPALVPYDRIWRVGANESTKITFEHDFVVDGHTLPQGKYALYIFPYREYWEVVFHKNTGHWGDGRANYDPSEDALRVKVVPIKTMQYHENLLLTFENITHNSAQLIIQWARTKAVVSFATDTKRIMENEIREKLANSPTGQTYYEIARYYQEEGIRLDEALPYLGKALQMNGKTYYFYRVKALVEGDLGDYTAAIESAKKSIQLAEKENKDEFVRLNQKDIKVWQEELKNN
ncbi:MULTISPECIES: DUF2911 domain-containing protein [Maribacter]|uniref:DUF2911 domain-containing protein n=1 Tax=Maribacter flavus TaxID=1658664 RepID=A0ABU7IMG4_9FLAO|nr:MULTISPECIES: DUF2911 domain-containing protein [Maribacter]MDC6406695.1 DUF2911 domain-containing protein [Maribacter sp. PR66]MEE1973863.1 DUF2911 domain-containing protein [Maribacter flavus]